MITILFNELTQEELQMLDYYRNNYAFDINGEVLSEPSEIEYILRHWNKENKTLFKLLDNNLIISKDFVYHKSYDELEEEILSMIFLNEKDNFCDCYNEMIDKYFPWNRNNIEIRGCLLNLISDALVKNEYEKNTIILPPPNNTKKPLKIQKGCKAIKTLGKIAELYNIPYFEQFRIDHSRILNQKTLSGKLTLSIHPLDFWTMSDNDCDWHTCLNWNVEKGGGGSQLGVVEMMNSPTVIVAYLRADKDMDIDDKQWTNKKWRQLFIVDEQAIVSVKSYPYFNENLTLACMNWIKELAEKNLGWKYNDIKEYDTKSPEMPVRLKTFYMYDDWGLSKRHFYCYNPDLEKKDFGEKKNLLLTYSGVYECVNCGKSIAENVNMIGEHSPVCECCQKLAYCRECGEAMGEFIDYDGENYCYECFNYYTAICDVCDAIRHRDLMTFIYIVPKTLSVEKFYPWIIGEDSPAAVCSGNLDLWKEMYLKPNATIKKYYCGHLQIYCAIDEDFNEVGLQKYFSDYDGNINLDEYKKQYKDYVTYEEDKDLIEPTKIEEI